MKSGLKYALLNCGREILIGHTAHLFQTEYMHMVSGYGFKSTDKVGFGEQIIPLFFIREKTGMLLQVIKRVNVQPVFCPEAGAQHNVVSGIGGNGNVFCSLLGGMLSPPAANALHRKWCASGLFFQFQKITADIRKHPDSVIFQKRNDLFFKYLCAFAHFDFGKIRIRAFMNQVFVDRTLLQYIALIVQQTRTSKAVYLGASPRASVAMLQSSKAYALLQGRDFVTPEDIKFVAPYVLQHRLILTAEAEMEGYSPVKVTQRLIDKVEVPK